MSKLFKTLKDTGAIRWVALLCLALPMFASYFFDDIFSTINQEFEDPSMVALGWSMADYGFYRSAYSLLCIFGGLIICGMLLDRWGVRLTGSIFVGLMVGGAALITYAISESFAGSRLCGWLSGVFAKPSLSLAYAGCAMFGLGSEIAGVTVNRAIAKWFKGREIALAMGLQLALARLGTAVALIVVPRIVELEGYIPFSETSKPAVVGMVLLLGALVLWGLFVAMDYGADRRGAAAAGVSAGASDAGSSAEDRFRFRDVLKVITDRHFILISLLCVFFYCCVVSFRKFATAILMPRFGIDSDVASVMVAMIPFFTLVFAPLFGAVVDRVGRGTKIMILGSAMILFAHLTVAFAPGVPAFGFIAIGVLGLGYSLVPAAMWPSLPKIIAESRLGTAFSLVYWVQNIGLFTVPIVVGHIIDRASSPVVAEYFFIGLAVCAIVVSVLLSRSSVLSALPPQRQQIPRLGAVVVPHSCMYPFHRACPTFGRCVNAPPPSEPHVAVFLLPPYLSHLRKVRRFPAFSAHLRKVGATCKLSGGKIDLLMQ